MFIVLFCSVLQPSSIRGLAASRTTILQCSRFSVALKASSSVIPVHALILSCQAVIGLPRALFPGRLPSMISFSRQSAVFLTIWPKNRSFLATTDSRRFLSVSAFSITHSFVRFCVHDTRKISLRHFISKARIRASSPFFKVQLSHAYVATGHIRPCLLLKFKNLEN